MAKQKKRLIIIPVFLCVIIVSLLMPLLSNLRATPQNKVSKKCNQEYYGQIDVKAVNFVKCYSNAFSHIEDYKVILKSKALDKHREYFIASNDACVFDNLSKGKYTIIVKKDGYKKVKQKYNLKENQYISLFTDMVEKDEEEECDTHYSSIYVNAAYFQASTCKNKYLDKVYVTLESKDGKKEEAFINNNAKYFSTADFAELRPNTYTINTYKTKGNFKPGKYKLKLKEGQDVWVTVQMEKDD